MTGVGEHAFFFFLIRRESKTFSKVAFRTPPRRWAGSNPAPRPCFLTKTGDKTYASLTSACRFPGSRSPPPSYERRDRSDP